MENHEIRFNCSKELLETAEQLKKDLASDFTKSGFMKNVFILGLKQLTEQVKLKKKSLLEVFTK